MGKRYSIQLDEEHSARLEALAARAQVRPGTLARLLLSGANRGGRPQPGDSHRDPRRRPGSFRAPPRGAHRCPGRPEEAG